MLRILIPFDLQMIDVLAPLEMKPIDRTSTIATLAERQEVFPHRQGVEPCPCR